MKLNKLILTNFIAYPERVEIPFRELLETHRLLLIYGPTGAGKSTIMEGILYALFGYDQRRNLRSPISEYSPDQPTSLVLEFEIGGQKYRVERSWHAHKGRLKREHRWYQWNTEAWEPFDQRQLTRLFPLMSDFDLFRQVVLIPQGEYARFLKSEPRKRYETLVKLLPVGWAEHFVDILRQKVAELDAKRHQKVIKLQSLLDKEDLHDPVDAKPIVSALKKEIQSLLKKQNVLRETVHKKEKEREKLDEIYMQLQRIEGVFRTLINALEAFRKVEQRAEEIEAIRREIQRIEEFRALFQELFQKSETLKDRIHTNEQELKRLKDKLRKVKKTLKKLLPEIERLPAYREEIQNIVAETEKIKAHLKFLASQKRTWKNAQQKLRSLTKDIAKAKELLEIIRSLTPLAELEKVQMQIGELEGHRETVTRQWEKARGEIENSISIKKRFLKLLTILKALALWEELQELGKQDEAVTQKWKKIQREVEGKLQRQQRFKSLFPILKALALWDELQGLKREREKVEKKIQKLEEELLSIRKKERNAHLVSLVQELQEGVPCPLCGSPQHPSPFHPDESAPSLGQIEEERRGVQQKLNGLQKRLGEITGRLQDRCRAILQLGVVPSKLPSFGDVARELRELGISPRKTASCTLEMLEKEGLTEKSTEEEIRKLEKELEKNKREYEKELARIEERRKSLEERKEKLEVDPSKLPPFRDVARELRELGVAPKKTAGRTLEMLEEQGLTEKSVEEEIRKLEKELEENKREYEKELARIEERCKTLEEKKEELESNIPATPSLKNINRKLKKWGVPTKENAVSTLERLEEQGFRGHELEEQLRKMEKDQREYLTQIRQAQETLKTELGLSDKTISLQALREIDTHLREKQKELEKQKARLSKHIKHIEEQREVLEKQQAKLQGEIEKAKKVLTDEKKRLQRVERELLKAFSKAKFHRSEEDLYETNTLVRTLPQLQEKVHTWEKEKTQLRSKIETAIQILQDYEDDEMCVLLQHLQTNKLSPADLAMYEQHFEEKLHRVEEQKRRVGEKLSALQTKLKEIQKALGQLDEKRKEMKRRRKEADAIIKAWEQERENLEILNALLSVFSPSNNPKAFPYWVTRIYLAELLRNANVFLEEFSGGRYQFDLQALNAVEERLDIYVQDGYTGDVRDVQHLSGGEQFLTSLSLALGMAQTLVSTRGVEAPGFIFLDEGFGTLDRETLTQVAQILRAHANRQDLDLIIISHRQELQDYFPVRIRVIPSPQGSRIEIETHLGSV